MRGATFPGSESAHIAFTPNSFARLKSTPPGLDARSIIRESADIFSRALLPIILKGTVLKIISYLFILSAISALWMLLYDKQSIKAKSSDFLALTVTSAPSALKLRERIFPIPPSMTGGYKRERKI